MPGPFNLLLSYYTPNVKERIKIMWIPGYAKRISDYRHDKSIKNGITKKANTEATQSVNASVPRKRFWQEETK